jgi:cytochrome P450
MTTDPVTGIEPVAWNAELGAHVVSGFEEAAAILRDPAGWSSDPRRGPLAAPELRELPPSLILFMDPPDHTRLRQLLSPAFTPRAIEGLRPRVAAIVDAALDPLCDGADLLAEVGYLVPLAVIAELLDVGAEGAEIFQAETPRLTRILEVDAGPEELSEAMAAVMSLNMFLIPLLAERRSRPGRDFISVLASNDGLAIDEALATCLLLLAAGHETTANLIGNGALALLDHADQRPLLFEDPARAIEELLRFDGPVRLVGRVATTDDEIAGHRIPAGGQVLIRLDAVHRDPRRFTDPDRLDLGRTGPPHLAFGGGPHFCLGAALSRMEAAETLTRLFDRFPAMAPLDPVPSWRPVRTFHGLTELPVSVS